MNGLAFAALILLAALFAGLAIAGSPEQERTEEEVGDV